MTFPEARNYDLNQYELFIGYNLSERKMKKLLLKNFLSIAKESNTFSMNTGPDFGAEQFKNVFLNNVQPKIRKFFYHYIDWHHFQRNKSKIKMAVTL